MVTRPTRRPDTPLIIAVVRDGGAATVLFERGRLDCQVALGVGGAWFGNLEVFVLELLGAFFGTVHQFNYLLRLPILLQLK